MVVPVTAVNKLLLASCGAMQAALSGSCWQARMTAVKCVASAAALKAMLAKSADPALWHSARNGSLARQRRLALALLTGGEHVRFAHRRRHVLS